MHSKSALITGVTGQDGAYLAKRLLDDGYCVIGTYHDDNSSFDRLETLEILNHPNLTLQPHDLTHHTQSRELIFRWSPNEVYNLAGVSTIANADLHPLSTSEINALAPVTFLEAIRVHNPKIRFFQASSSEIFGSNRQSIQTESTKLAPSNSYGISKAYAHQMVEFYRDKYGLFASSGILYNHESPLRGLGFVTRKITSGLVNFLNNPDEFIEVGNLNAKRDWGHANDYVEAMTLCLNNETPRDYIISTGKMESVRSFVSLACDALNLKILWEGTGLSEKGIDLATGKTIVQINPKYYRPEPSENKTGTPKMAFDKLGWKATINLRQLCQEMISADLANKR